YNENVNEEDQSLKYPPGFTPNAEENDMNVNGDKSQKCNTEEVLAGRNGDSTNRGSKGDASESVCTGSKRFDKPMEHRAIVDMCYPRSLLIDQHEDLERVVTKEEVKRAVWDCGCNPSFIALIPKILDVNMVSDFRPISLIGSIYKIIAKFLANRLVRVLGDIVNEVQ
ncbi:hypothetical protein Tco_0148561, partial [Tanacetum coccineum]